MTLFYDMLKEAFLGYAAIFLFMGLGFLFLRGVSKGEVGPGYWTLGFFLNGLGFIFWSGVLPMESRPYFIIGEVLHVLGFFFLVAGAYRFSGYTYRPWNLYAVLAWSAAWLAAMLLVGTVPALSAVVLKALPAILFISSGALIILRRSDQAVIGRRLAGFSLAAWGAYNIAFAFFKLEAMLNLAFGILVGFQLLASLGLVVMVVDRMRNRAERDELQVKRLEGLLPICAYCKRIRDKDNTWHSLELYIEDHSKAEFSHGICPECFEKHQPDK